MLPDFFHDSNGEIVWSAVSATVSAISATLVFVGVIMNICTQRKIAKQQIDANLKAKARIEWINGVRQESSELISLLLSLQKENIDFSEQWIKVEEVAELLKLFFNTKETKSIATEIYIDKNTREICMSLNAIEKLYDETKNQNKHIYIRRYIECLIDLYRGESYKQILIQKRIISSKIHDLTFVEMGYIMDGITTVEEAESKMSVEELKKYEKHKQELESAEEKEKKLEKLLISYKKSVEDLSIIIGIYLKLEWDKAKKGK